MFQKLKIMTLCLMGSLCIVLSAGMMSTARSEWAAVPNSNPRIVQRSKPKVSTRVNPKVTTRSTGNKFKLAEPGTPKIGTGSKPMIGTWLKGGLFSEIGDYTFTEITINSPQTLKFEWGTNSQEADKGVWRLMHAGTLLATGDAGSAPWSFFSIDLTPYLPPNPPATPDAYIVQVIAKKSGYIAQTGQSSGDVGSKVPEKAFGVWSNSVVITYTTPGPPQTFYFPEVYRTATLVLDKIKLVEDQSGPGAEEYFLSGFIQESFINCNDFDGQNCKFTSPGQQFKFAPDLNYIDLSETCDEITLAPYFRCLNPPSISNFGFANYAFGVEKNWWSFNLNSVALQWPRKFTVGLSLMEQDNGALMSPWLNGFNFIKDKISTGDLLIKGNLDSGDLNDLINEYGLDVLDAIDMLDAIATTVASAVTDGGSIAAGIAGAGATVAVTATIIGAIISASEDDYYGTKFVSLTLPSNRVEVIHQLPGVIVGNMYVVDSETQRFYGPASSASFDGIVDITFHWEFSDREYE